MKAAEPPKSEIHSFWRCLCAKLTGVHRIYCESCGRHRTETPTKDKK